jgi:hypothetical protein
VARLFPSTECMLGDSRQMTPAVLAAKMLAIMGAKCIGQLIGDSLERNVLGQVTSWPSTAGWSCVNRYAGKFKSRVWRGRRWLYDQDANSVMKILGCAAMGQNMSSTIAVSSPPSVLPFPAGVYPTMVAKYDSGAGLGEFLTGSQTSSNWYNPLTWHYCDGAASEVVQAVGVHVYEGDITDAPVPGIQIGGSTAGQWSWTTAYAGVGYVIALTTPPTAQQRAAAVTLLRQYFMI